MNKQERVTELEEAGVELPEGSSAAEVETLHNEHFLANIGEDDKLIPLEDQEEEVEEEVELPEGVVAVDEIPKGMVQMIENVTHDGVAFSKGDSVSLSDEDTKLFKVKGFIA